MSQIITANGAESAEEESARIDRERVPSEVAILQEAAQQLIFRKSHSCIKGCILYLTIGSKYSSPK
jgi:hypothetical protein